MPYAGHLSEFARFQQYLVGSWKNENFPSETVGGNDNPLSYNIMPLPDKDTPLGYILKNFKYNEIVRFNSDHATAHPAKAPNRGGDVTQNAFALFYDQKVHFAEGTHSGEIVHVENGTWLYLQRIVQKYGVFPGSDETESDPKKQPNDLTIAKQIAVPHGNSVLALGSFETVLDTATNKANPIIQGKPIIPDAPFPFPIITGSEVPPLDVSMYETEHDGNDYLNPHSDLTKHPNLPLQTAMGILNPDAYIHWHVTTEPSEQGNGTVTNIPFEQRLSRVTDYWADYWLLSTDNGSNFNYLAYTQTMSMKMYIKDNWYICPHITCNVLTKE